MELLQRISQVIIPVFFIVTIGYLYVRRKAPDMSVPNRITLDVLALVFCSLGAGTGSIDPPLASFTITL